MASEIASEMASEIASEMALELVSHALCPFVQRAIILLLEKEVPCQITYIDLLNKPDWFCQLSPLGKVPLLKVGTDVIFESAVICEYLDEITPASLHPLDPLEKAKHRAWIEFGSSLLNTLYELINASTKEIFEQKRCELTNKLFGVEKALQTPYFAGKTFSMVDAAYASLFYYLDALDAIADFSILADSPKIKVWQRAIQQRPSVQRAFTQDYIQQLLTALAQRSSYLSGLAQTQIT
jgi:glutathione S-transferase